MILLTVIIAGCCNDKSNQQIDYNKLTSVEDGKAVSVVLTCYSTTLIANGEDTTSIRVAVHTIKGNEITNATNEIILSVEGEATLIDDAGEVLKYETDSSGLSFITLNLVDGLAHLKLVTGNKPGIIKLEAKSERLWTGGHEIHTIPEDFKILRPDYDQLEQTGQDIGRMIGADISWLPEQESREKKFYDKDVEKDGISLLKDHGFNYVRLRIFVNPENAEGYSPDLGYCGLDQTLKMAKRVKEAGMNLLLDFHYSDYWADPQKQFKPKAWEGLSFEVLSDTVKNYTSSVLTALKAQGTLPDMVQVGNEINHGMIWPDGHISNLDNLSELLKAGIAGVREVAPEMPIMLHIATGGLNKESVFWFDNMIARGVNFDIIGVSYYPRWHGTLNDLRDNITDLSSRYKKPVNVVEYSWFKNEVHDIVFNLPENIGKGAAIWEPYGWGEHVIDKDGNTNELIMKYDNLANKYLKK